jgi:hypothetical protein
MEGDKTPTYEDAQLILKLYELRREEKLREARDWYFREFFPEKVEDIQEILTAGHPHNAHFRMVVSYWDMAASFAVRGPLNASLLLESSGEMLVVWAKLEKFMDALREYVRLPEYLRNIEDIIHQVEWAPDRVNWLHSRIANRPAQPSEPESA